MNFAIVPFPTLENRKYHILVVEDKIVLRYTLAEWLRSLNYTVLEAASADEAKDILNSFHTVDLVVTDVQMPGSMDGVALTHHILSTFPAIKIIMVSGDPDRRPVGDRERSLFMAKPYDLTAVAAHIARLLASPEPN